MTIWEQLQCSNTVKLVVKWDRKCFQETLSPYKQLRVIWKKKTSNGIQLLCLFW